MAHPERYCHEDFAYTGLIVWVVTIIIESVIVIIAVIIVASLIIVAVAVIRAGAN
jgi:hypothetical protein